MFKDKKIIYYMINFFIGDICRDIFIRERNILCTSIFYSWSLFIE